MFQPCVWRGLGWRSLEIIINVEDLEMETDGRVRGGCGLIWFVSRRLKKLINRLGSGTASWVEEKDAAAGKW